MTLRLATAADAEALAALHRAVFEGAGWDEAFWRQAARSSHDRVLILGEPARGFAALRLLGDEAEILTLGTTAKRQGDGRFLLVALAYLARAEGARRLFLEVSAANKAALGLYRSARFETVGARRGYYADGTDAVVMRRTLVEEETDDGPS